MPQVIREIRGNSQFVEKREIWPIGVYRRSLLKEVIGYLDRIDEDNVLPANRDMHDVS